MIVNRSKGLARFAFMHCIAASLCFWLFAIKNETLDSILNKTYYYEKSYCTYDDGTSNNPYDDNYYGGYLWGDEPAARLEEDGKAGA